MHQWLYIEVEGVNNRWKNTRSATHENGSRPQIKFRPKSSSKVSHLVDCKNEGDYYTWLEERKVVHYTKERLRNRDGCEDEEGEEGEVGEG